MIVLVTLHCYEKYSTVFPLFSKFFMMYTEAYDTSQLYYVHSHDILVINTNPWLYLGFV